MKILIDTDICLDFITGRSPHGRHAQKLFNEIEETGHQALISPHSFPNMFYILGRQYRFTDIIPALKTFRALVTVAPLTHVEIDAALDSGWNDFEDAIQYHCAQNNAGDAIITRNRQDFTQSALPILSPREFLDQLNKSDQ